MAEPSTTSGDPTAPVNPTSPAFGSGGYADPQYDQADGTDGSTGDDGTWDDTDDKTSSNGLVWPNFKYKDTPPTEEEVATYDGLFITTDASGAQDPQAASNADIMPYMMDHPFCVFAEQEFLEMLEKSQSLEVSQKKEVIDAIPNLVQSQIDDLHKVFRDERMEFSLLLRTEGDDIRKLVVTRREEWSRIQAFYRSKTELRSMQPASSEEDQLQEIRKKLGL